MSLKMEKTPWGQDSRVQTLKAQASSRPESKHPGVESPSVQSLIIQPTRVQTSRVEEVVKQGIIFGPIMCCASTSKVNTIQEAVNYQYGKVVIGMAIFMDDIAVLGTADKIRIGAQNCRRMEIEKKVIYRLKKTKYMVINIGK